MRNMRRNNYTVKAGDNLWSISERFYGNGEHWDSIYAENVYLIGSNPDYLIEGLTFNISSRPLSYVEITKIMIGYYGGIIKQASVNSEEPPREVGILFRYQDTLMRIRVIQGFIIVMLLLLLFAAFG